MYAVAPPSRRKGHARIVVGALLLCVVVVHVGSSMLWDLGARRGDEGRPLQVDHSQHRHEAGASPTTTEEDSRTEPSESPGPKCPALPFGGICSGHGSCGDDDRCVCAASASDGHWAGDVCNRCEPGWYGPACALECPGGADGSCSGHGRCSDGVNGTGSCRCDAGAHGYWGGKRCQDCDDSHFGEKCAVRCPRARRSSLICGGHGRCNAGMRGDGMCICDANYVLEGSVCTACAPHMFGQECDRRCPSTTNGTCNGHGACRDGRNGNGTCSCDVGWNGTACEMGCPATDGILCGGHGTCDASGACRCDFPYSVGTHGSCTECVGSDAHGSLCEPKCRAVVPEIRYLDDVVPDAGDVAMFYATELVRVPYGKPPGPSELMSGRGLYHRVLPVLPLEAYGLLGAGTRYAVESRAEKNITADVRWYMKQRWCTDVTGIRNTSTKYTHELDAVVSLYVVDEAPTWGDVEVIFERVMGRVGENGAAVILVTLQRGVGDNRRAVTTNGFAVLRLVQWFAEHGYFVDPMITWTNTPPVLLVVGRRTCVSRPKTVRVSATAGIEAGRLERTFETPMLSMCRFEGWVLRFCANEPIPSCLSRHLRSIPENQCKDQWRERVGCVAEAMALAAPGKPCAGQTPGTCLRMVSRHHLRACARTDYYRLASQWRRWRFRFAPYHAAVHRPRNDVPVVSSRLMPLQMSTAARKVNYLQLDDVAVTDALAVWSVPRNAELYCTIVMAHTNLCHDHEYVDECILRLGAFRLQRWIGIRCACSEWFKELVRRENPHLRENAPESCLGWRMPDGTIPSPSDLVPLFTSGGEDQPMLGRIGGIIPGSMVGDGRPPRYVPPSERVPIPIPDRVYRTVHGATVYRLPMSIPEEVIPLKAERRKWFDINPFKPTRFPTHEYVSEQYIFGAHDEVVARELSARSYFVFTHRRGCWTAHRHIDILAAGSIPLFLDLHYCSDYEKCFPGYPAALVEKALKLPGISHVLRERHDEFIEATPRRYYEHNVYNPKPAAGIGRSIDWSKFNETAYFEIADQLLAHTRKYLTTKSVAVYFLERMGVPDAKCVFVEALFGLPETHGLIHGLAALGVTVVMNQDGDGMRASRAFKKAWAADERVLAHDRRFIFPKYRGAGHMYAFRTKPGLAKACKLSSLHGNTSNSSGNGGDHQPSSSDREDDDGNEVDCLAWMKQGRFDALLFSVLWTLHKDNTFYESYVRDNVPPGKVGFVDGVDQANSFDNDDIQYLLDRGHVLFSREMYYDDPVAMAEKGARYEPPPP